MIRNHLSPRTAVLLTAALALALGVAAGGDDDSISSDNSSTAASTTTGSDTVTVQSVSGVGDALVDAEGQVLYTNDMDTGSKVACSGECVAIWVPLTVSAGTTPTGPSDLGGKLGVVTNPAGDQQVTLDGKPLYTFTQDSAGEATGDGFTDSFGGTTFTWSVASNGAGAAATTPETTTSSSSSSDGGGYGY